ncbi:hypothetical protein OH492_10845 [Vibrio chagasii]|nr:hypothetical protein [Vibrio chagasii]
MLTISSRAGCCSDLRKRAYDGQIPTVERPFQVGDTFSGANPGWCFLLEEELQRTLLLFLVAVSRRCRRQSFVI